MDRLHNAGASHKRRPDPRPQRVVLALVDQRTPCPARDPRLRGGAGPDRSPLWRRQQRGALQDLPSGSTGPEPVHRVRSDSENGVAKAVPRRETPRQVHSRIDQQFAAPGLRCPRRCISPAETNGREIAAHGCRRQRPDHARLSAPYWPHCAAPIIAARSHRQFRRELVRRRQAISTAGRAFAIVANSSNRTHDVSSRR